MKKHHIRFNKAQLRTEVIPYTAKDYVLWLVKRVVMVAGIAAGAVMIFDQYFESPKVRRQQRQIAFLEAQVDLMDGKVEGMRGALAELTDRDEAIYRNIFGAEPYPEHLRNPGIGGADRYRELRGLEQSEQVIALRAEISELERRMLAQGESFSQLVSLTENRKTCSTAFPPFNLCGTAISSAWPVDTAIASTRFTRSENALGHGFLCANRHGDFRYRRR